MSVELHNLAYGTPMTLQLLSRATTMSTRPTTLMIEKVLRVDASFLETTWSLGLAKKQDSISLSTAEAEYIVAGSNYLQLI